MGGRTIITGALAVLVGCAAGEDTGVPDEVDGRMLTIHLQTPDDPPLAIGTYDLQVDAIALDTAIVDAASEFGAELNLTADAETFELDDGRATTPYALAEGDVLALTAGDAVRWYLVVGPPGVGDELDADEAAARFAAAREEQEITEATSGPCQAFPYGGKTNGGSWGCGGARGLTVYDENINPLYTEYTYSIDDRLTDGYCVQVWFQDVTGRWYESDARGSCGAPITVVGTSPRALRKIRLFRGSFGGKYATLWP